MKKLNDFEFRATAKRAADILQVINAKLDYTEQALAKHAGEKKAA